MKRWKKFQALLLTVLMILNLSGTAFADQAVAGGQAQAGDLVVLYTNDVHTHVDNEGLRYSNVAAMKKDLEVEL